MGFRRAMEAPIVKGPIAPAPNALDFTGIAPGLPDRHGGRLGPSNGAVVAFAIVVLAEVIRTGTRPTTRAIPSAESHATNLHRQFDPRRGCLVVQAWDAQE